MRKLVFPLVLLSVVACIVAPGFVRPAVPTPGGSACNYQGTCRVGLTAPGFTGPLAGNASTATALAADPAACAAGQYARDIAANGTLTCSTPPSGSPAGPADSVQYNSAGAFAGDAQLQWLPFAASTLRVYNAGGYGLQLSGEDVRISAVSAPLLLTATTGGVQLGSILSAGITATYQATATLATAAIAAGSTAAQTITVPNAAVGAECTVGGPSTLEAGLLQTCLVTSAGNVQLRTGNVTAASITPAAAQTVSVRVWAP